MFAKETEQIIAFKTDNWISGYCLTSQFLIYQNSTIIYEERWMSTSLAWRPEHPVGSEIEINSPTLPNVDSACHSQVGIDKKAVGLDGRL